MQGFHRWVLAAPYRIGDDLSPRPLDSASSYAGFADRAFDVAVHVDLSAVAWSDFLIGVSMYLSLHARVAKAAGRRCVYPVSRAFGIVLLGLIPGARAAT